MAMMASLVDVTSEVAMRCRFALRYLAELFLVLVWSISAAFNDDTIRFSSFALACLNICTVELVVCGRNP